MIYTQIIQKWLDTILKNINLYARFKTLLITNRVRFKNSEISLIVIWDYESRISLYSYNYGKYMSHLLRNYKHVLIDTSHMKNTIIDIDNIVEKYFQDNKPMVYFPNGRWIGNKGNSITGGKGLKKILDIEDQKVDKQFHEMIKPNDIKYFIYRYKSDETDDLIKQTLQLDIKSYYWPHYIDSSVFKDRNPTKAYDILFWGGDLESYYPFRNRIRKLLEKNRNRFNIRIIKRSEKIKRKQLSIEIGKSWLTVATTVGDHDRFVRKYLENAFSGSCILGNIPSRHRSIFEGYCVEITESMSDVEILAKIETVLSNKKLLRLMSTELGKKLSAEYNFDKGDKEFHKIIHTIYTDKL